ncbi:Gfo/Idh/MocA family oxidoreductase [Paenibacillus whitsoniae]|uniref:Oxidoreductase n=1 Tax=Paenibacillus whitsoniae TaxID=2496558 RepID=A0A3S0I7S5_9BACL|nr:Gfo/Idh/MocA family oxidoreductase [Paenibacillus whitsoniae]RTE05522.1 oxidoreductase [Paenibacillus whitsoniae]
MTRKKIGLVDLDTSHPASFVPILREMGYEVATIFDGGTVHPAGYAERFAHQHSIPHVASSLQEVVQKADIAFLHGCNWELRTERARPFIEAGIPVFLDKPVAGSPEHLRILADWAKQGAVLTGGSALRVSDEVKAWQAEAIPPDEWVYGLAGCAIDEFNYGIHAYAMVQGLLGPGIAAAQHKSSQGGQRQVELTWADGRRFLISVGETKGYLPFYANLVTQTTTHYIRTDNSKLYRALLNEVMPYLSGDTTEPPIPFDLLIEIELAALAAKLSEEQGGRRIELADIPLNYAGYDGQAFAQSYRDAKYPPVGGAV